MSEKVKIRVFIRTSNIGSTCEEDIEFEREEWDAMTDDQKEASCRDTAFNMGEWGWKELI